MSAARTPRERSDAPRKPLRRRRRRGAANKPLHEFTDDSRGPRLQRILNEAGVGSRRACEQLIESGAVRVNGHVVSLLPAWVDPVKDHISVNGRHIRSAQPHVYVMLFKPRGVVSTNSDPEGRSLVVDMVKHPSRARLYPVGRLDMDTSGLLLLTNDGELANRLTHPRHEVRQSYQVSIDGAFGDEELGKLERGLFPGAPRIVRARGPVGMKKNADARVTVIKRERDRTSVKLTLAEGQNRQIRTMLARLGYKVRKLRRVQMGPLKLRGLQPGQWRELTYKELRDLKKAAGIKET